MGSKTSVTNAPSRQSLGLHLPVVIGTVSEMTYTVSSGTLNSSMV